MFKNILLIACITSTLGAQSAQDFKNEQMQGFNKEKKQFGIYKKSQEEEFEAYQKEQNKVYKDYKKELGVFWEEPKISTKKTWVSYTEDKQTRTDVDFSKETITLETIASSPEQAKQKLQMALAKVVTVDTKTVQETDPLEKKLSKIKKPIGVVDADVKAEPILSTIVFKKPPTKASVNAYVKKYV
jgi:membrane-bound lytic murein transglycosylase C